MPKPFHFQTMAGGREITFRESWGEAMFSAVFYGIGYGFFILAIANLLFVRPLSLAGLLTSLVWIAIILWTFVSGFREVGMAQHLGNVLGRFVRNRFVEVTTADSGERILCFGYQWGSRRHYFLKLRANGVKAVDWGAGQGNDPRRDNCWYVALWFDAGSIVFNGEGPRAGIHIVGPSGPKLEAEGFGREFIEFLRANDISLPLPSVELLGQEAEVVERLRPRGRIRVGAVEYGAHTIMGFIEKGSRVGIEEIRGTSIYVRNVGHSNSP